MKKPVSIGIASLLTAQLGGPLAHAQEDFPPPPPADFAGGAAAGMPTPPAGDSGSYAPGDAGAANKKGEVLNKKQRQGFNRAGSEDITNANYPETIESFDFPNVDINDVIHAISELTGKNFIIDPGVRGKITIIAPSKLTVAEAYKAFLSALAINGFTVVPSGGFLKVKSARNAQRDSIETYSGAYYPNTDQMITRIIHLKHISAEQVNRDLRILPSKDGEMSVYTPTNSIILSDYGSNIDRVMKIIGELDVPGFEEQLEVIPIKYAKVKDLADLIDKIINKGQKSTTSAGVGGTFTAGVPRFSRTTGSSSTQGASSFMAIPDERTNSIIVVGNKSGIQRIKKLISQLDFKIRTEDAGGVYVYYVKNGDAEKIQQTLSGVTKDAQPKPAAGGSLLSPMGVGGQFTAPQEIFGSEVKITADKTTNSLVITASKQDYETVLNILSKLDIPRDQVFVEAIIMEMTTGDADNWQVGYYQYGPSGYGKTGFNGGVSLADFISPVGAAGATLGFGMGSNVTITDPTTQQTYKIPSLLGLVSFLKKNQHANILSTPTIMALDNQEAEIEVGDQVVISTTTQTATNGTTTNSANFGDATIKLNIKPFISPTSNAIRMEIKQQVKQLSQANTPKDLQGTTQPLATRAIKTTINVNNGDTAILGGLMKDQDTEVVQKVPLLGDIPIIGWLFKSKQVTKDKVNMVVFLTPKIVRNSADSNHIISKTLNDRIDFIKGQGGRDPYGKRMDELARKVNGAPGAGTNPDSDLDAVPTTMPPLNSKE